MWKPFILKLYAVRVDIRIFQPNEDGLAIVVASLRMFN